MNYNGVNIAVVTTLITRNRSIATISGDPAMLTSIDSMCSVVAIRNGNISCSALGSTNTSGTSLLMTAASSSRRGVLSYFFTGHVNATGAVTQMHGRGCSSTGLTFVHRRLKLSVAVGPRHVTTQRVCRVLQLPSTTGVRAFSRHGVRVVRVLLHTSSPLIKTPLDRLHNHCGTGFLVYMTRQKSRIFVPSNGFILRTKSRVNVATSPRRFRGLLQNVNVIHGRTHRIVLLNNDHAARCLTGRLLTTKISIHVVRSSHIVYSTLSRTLPGTIIVRNSNTRRRLLVRRKLGRVSTFITLANVSRRGVLLSFFTVSRGIPGIITGIAQSRLNTLKKQLKLRYIMSPQRATASDLMRCTHTLRGSVNDGMRALCGLVSSHTRTLRFGIRTSTGIVNVPLGSLTLGPQILITNVLHRHGPLVPTNSSIVLPKSGIIIMTTGRQLRSLSSVLTWNVK